MDYSMLDALRSPLRSDCSLLRFLRPVPASDLTRRPTLSAPRLLRIAPHSPPCARAVRGSPRATDCSVVQHLELLPRLRIAPPTMAGIPRRAWIAPRPPLPALRRSRIAPRSPPGPPRRSTDCSVLWRFAPVVRAWIAPCPVLSSAPPQITLCPTLDALSGSRIAPLAFLRALKLTADCSAVNPLEFRINSGLLRRW